MQENIAGPQEGAVLAAGVTDSHRMLFMAVDSVLHRDGWRASAGYKLTPDGTSGKAMEGTVPSLFS